MFADLGSDATNLLKGYKMDDRTERRLARLEAIFQLGDIDAAPAEAPAVEPDSATEVVDSPVGSPDLPGAVAGPHSEPAAE